MNRNQIETIYNQISNIRISFKNQVVLLKNKLKMKEQLDLISEVKKIRHTEKFKTYRELLEKLYQKFGNVQDDKIVIPPNLIDAFESEKLILDLDFGSVLDEQRQLDSEFYNFMNETVDFDFEYILIDDISNEELEMLSSEEIMCVMSFVKH